MGLHYFSPRGGYNSAEAAYALRALEHPPGMTLIDLLVRELIQNSLDAKLSGENVSVDVDIFPPSAAQKKFWDESLGDKAVGPWVRNRLSCEDWVLLRFSDTGTSGLNGPTDAHTELEGPEPARFQRIAFRFGQPQTKLNGGGSWGLGGKTVVFRLAAQLGLVAYYSRPADSKENSRLILVHCFDHKGQGTVVQDQCPLGFVWWGARAEHDEVAALEGAAADATARSIGFEADQSSAWRGTQVLIPLPRSAIQYLLPQDTPEDLSGENGKIWDTKTIRQLAEDINQTVLRWWWPRLTGRVNSRGELDPSDLNVKIRNWDFSQNMFFDDLSASPQASVLYRVWSRLYRRAFCVGEEDQSDISQLCGKRYGGYPLGTLVKYICEPESPEGRVFQKEKDRIAVSEKNWAVALIRNMGMVVSYRSSGVVPSSGELRLPVSGDGVCLAVARLSGHQSVAASKEDHEQGRATLTLEQIFRVSEDSAHNIWAYSRVADKENVIGAWPKRYVSQFATAIAEALCPKADNLDLAGDEPSLLSSLSHLLGRALMPVGIGPGPGTTSKTTGTGGGGGRGQRPKVKLLSLKPLANEGEYVAQIDLSGTDTAQEVALIVLDESGKRLDSVKWTKNTDEVYPVKIFGATGANKSSVMVAPGTVSVKCRVTGDWFVDVAFAQSLEAE